MLDRYDGAARMVGGGTDLLLEIQQGIKPRVEALVDPTRITGLDAIVEDGEFLVIGCAFEWDRGRFRLAGLPVPHIVRCAFR